MGVSSWRASGGLVWEASWGKLWGAYWVSGALGGLFSLGVTGFRPYLTFDLKTSFICLVAPTVSSWYKFILVTLVSDGPRALGHVRNFYEIKTLHNFFMSTICGILVV